MDDSNKKARKFFPQDTTIDSSLSVDEPAGDGQTVECPFHKLPLQIQTENREVKDGKGKSHTVIVRFATCGCRVPDNNHRGQRVWEQVPEVKE